MIFHWVKEDIAVIHWKPACILSLHSPLTHSHRFMCRHPRRHGGAEPIRCCWLVPLPTLAMKTSDQPNGRIPELHSRANAARSTERESVRRLLRVEAATQSGQIWCQCVSCIQALISQCREKLQVQEISQKNRKKKHLFSMRTHAGIVRKIKLLYKRCDKIFKLPERCLKKETFWIDKSCKPGSAATRWNPNSVLTTLWRDFNFTFFFF